MTVVWRGLQGSFYKFLDDTQDKLSNSPQDTTKYWYLHSGLLQFINDFTNSRSALHRRGKSSSNSRGGKLTKSRKSSKYWKYLCVGFWVFFVEVEGMAQISIAEHCGSGRKRAAPSSKLKQVKKMDIPSLSHPSQAHRLLQMSHCAKQLALQKIMFSFEDLCNASAS